MRKMGILNKLNYQAGLLNDGAAAEETVITPDEQAELITESAEVVTNPEVAEAEVLLNEIVAEDEIVTEELGEVQEEQEVVAEGLQSDFTAVTTRNMIKSIEKINARYGEGSILTAGMQSDRFGGHKDLYVAGLQAKENFFKNAAKNILALIQSFIDKIKELAKKVVIFLNNDEKAALALVTTLKAKTDALKEGIAKELDEKEQSAIGNKFGAWLSIGGKVETFAKIVPDVLGEEVTIDIKYLEKYDPKNPDSLIESSRKTLDAMIGDNKTVKTDYPNAFGISVIGKTIKLLSNNDGKLSVNTVTVSDADYKDALPKEVPALDVLMTSAVTAAKIAGNLKTYASNAWKSVEEFKKYIKDQSAEDESFHAKKNAVIAANQIAMADLSFYTSSQKTMIWFAGAFASKYQDVKKDAKK